MMAKIKYQLEVVCVSVTSGSLLERLKFKSLDFFLPGMASVKLTQEQNAIFITLLIPVYQVSYIFFVLLT